MSDPLPIIDVFTTASRSRMKLASKISKLLVCWGLLSASLCVFTAAYESENSTNELVFLEWAADVSTIYPPSSPLEVQLGDELMINCPEDGISNIWILSHHQQYDQCKCNATGVNLTAKSCDPKDINTKHVCQDEVAIQITSVSQNTNTLRGFFPDTTYYLMSYSPGENPLDGYLANSEGGQCLDGYKMVLYVLPLQAPTTTGVPTTAVASTTTEVTRPETTEEELTTQEYSDDATMLPPTDLGDDGMTLHTNATALTGNIMTLIVSTTSAFLFLLIILAVTFIIMTATYCVYRRQRNDKQREKDICYSTVGAASLPIKTTNMSYEVYSDDTPGSEGVDMKLTMIAAVNPTYTTFSVNITEPETT